MRIFISGPYSADDDAGRLRNTHRALRVAHELLALGHAPFVPHLSHYFDLWAEGEYGERLPYETYMAWDLAWLERSDALFLIAPSPGAVRERDIAHELGIPVYTNLGQIGPAVEYAKFVEHGEVAR